MYFSELANKKLETIKNPNKDKYLTKFLGAENLLRKIRSLPGNQLGNFRVGAFFLACIFGCSAYYFHTQYNKTVYMSSHSYYRLMHLPSLDAGAQFWLDHIVENNGMPTLYYRMPKKEYDVIYRMRSAYISGEFDHNKEILIPTKKNGESGYDIFTPFYYYNIVSETRFAGLNSDGSTHENYDILKGALPVYRGW